jgi:ribonuclease HII
MTPTTQYEQEYIAQGYQLVAGIDEAGRGCWAGPVVAAAVVLPPEVLHDPALLAGVDDSKALSATKRAALFERICTLALGYGVGVVPAHVIDTHGILPATRLAMQIAILRLPCIPQALLIDAVKLDWPTPQQALIKGDSRCLSIAAASVIAKVTRDRLLDALDPAFPHYGLAIHKGYGTAYHEQALVQYGLTPLHRRTFRPMVSFVQNGHWPASSRRESGTIPAIVPEGAEDDD